MQLGLEVFLNNPPRDLLKKKWGLLSNLASVDHRGHYSKDLLRGKFQNNLRCLFSPQHGFWGTEQDNMVETPDSRDPATGLPLHSLYSHTRRPTPESLAEIEVLLIDLQDVGTRVYTFITSLAYCLEEAGSAGIEVMVLDRPNPLGGQTVEGNPLRAEMRSFVGVWELPMRHGLTPGELALLFNREMAIGASLRVVALRDWDRGTAFDRTGRLWLPPSPNMPTVETAFVYPGQVLLEGTTISEGRGTTRPFEYFGAPFLEPDRIKKILERFPLPGVHLMETAFRPTFQKWQGEVCRGFFLQVTDRETFRPYRTTLALLQALLELYPRDFQWKQPPYEYEQERMPIDLLIGDPAVRQALEAGTPVAELEKSWEQGLEEFKKIRERYLLY
ncbi:MAG: DUF1343 domain-containing protein [Desulfobacterota bacterium]|nr:DUF1343 domain-containing protein [Thermodesulfobacteriota bacterium]